MDEVKFLQKAIEKSQQSVTFGGFPVGVIIVKNGNILASGVSNGKQLNDPTSHAEIEAIRTACKKMGTRDLKDVVLYSFLEPCLMCFAASIWASIPKIVYACARNRVSKQHYEGDYNLALINKKSRHQIEFAHFSKLEKQALKVIEDWENRHKEFFRLL